jgi:hypothetical protein
LARLSQDSWLDLQQPAETHTENIKGKETWNAIREQLRDSCHTSSATRLQYSKIF